MCRTCDCSVLICDCSDATCDGSCSRPLTVFSSLHATSEDDDDAIVREGDQSHLTISRSSGRSTRHSLPFVMAAAPKASTVGRDDQVARATSSADSPDRTCRSRSSRRCRSRAQFPPRTCRPQAQRGSHRAALDEHRRALLGAPQGPARLQSAPNPGFPPTRCAPDRGRRNVR